MQPDAAIGKRLFGGRQPIGGPADRGIVLIFTLN
jgi:hypothetical protein